jgi:hypothetical protein
MRGDVIQGKFLSPVSRFTAPPPAPPACGSLPAEDRTARPLPGAPAVTRHPVQTASSIQRHSNGQAFRLPEALVNFGGNGGQPPPNPVRRQMESFFHPLLPMSGYTRSRRPPQSASTKPICDPFSL